jgi:hypothetical protein
MTAMMRGFSDELTKIALERDANGEPIMSDKARAAIVGAGGIGAGAAGGYLGGGAIGERLAAKKGPEVLKKYVRRGRGAGMAVAAPVTAAGALALLHHQLKKPEYQHLRKTAAEQQNPLMTGAKRLGGLGLGTAAGYGGAGLLYGAIKGEPGTGKAWKALTPTKRFRLAQIALAGGGGGVLLANALRDKARREGR